MKYIPYEERISDIIPDIFFKKSKIAARLKGEIADVTDELERFSSEVSRIKSEPEVVGNLALVDDLEDVSRGLASVYSDMKTIERRRL